MSNNAIHKDWKKITRKPVMYLHETTTDSGKPAFRVYDERGVLKFSFNTRNEAIEMAVNIARLYFTPPDSYIKDHNERIAALVRIARGEDVQ